MNRKVLIIRSVSFQQLDKNLKSITSYFEASSASGESVVKDSEITYYLLTHGHGTNRALKYPVFSADTIIDYESRRNFNVFHLPRKLRKERFDAVVVPVTNKSGAGFINVFLMTLRIKTHKIYRCNLVSEIKPVSRVKLTADFLKACLYTVCAIPLTAVSIPVLPLLLIPSLFRRK